MELEKKDLQEIINKYSIGHIVFFKRIKQGFQNYTYILNTNKGKYTLRIGKKTKKRSDILFEVILLNNIKGKLTPKYIRDKEKKYVNQFKGHNYVIYRYIEGHTPKKVSDELMKRVIIFLADFHKQSGKLKFLDSKKRFAWYTLSETKINWYVTFLLKNIKENKDEILYLKKELLKNKLPRNIPSGPIHCDVKPENLLVDKGNLNGVVDFDNCQIGPFILDLAISIIWFCTSKKGIDYNKTHIFIKKYNSIRKLSKEERKSLAAAIKFAYLSHELIDYYVYAKGIISKEYLNFGREYFLNAYRNIDQKKLESVAKI